MKFLSFNKFVKKYHQDKLSTFMIEKKHQIDLRNKWSQVLVAFLHPIVIITLFLGIFFTIFAVNSDETEKELQTIYTVISAIGIGIGVNYFTHHLNKLDEDAKKKADEDAFKLKAQHTVVLIDTAIKSILRKDNLNIEDKNLIDILLMTMDSMKDYYPKADISKIEVLKKIRAEITEEKSEEVKHTKQMLLTKMEVEAGTDGVGSFIPLSGGTIDMQINFKQP